MQTARRLCLSSLIILLVVTAQGLMSARGAMAAEGQICARAGPDIVVLAEDGLPLVTAAGEFVLLDDIACLDCVFGTPSQAQPLLGVADLASFLPAELSSNPSEHARPSPAAGGLARAPPVRI